MHDPSAAATRPPAPVRKAGPRGLARSLFSVDLWRRTGREFIDDEVPTHAAHVAFFAFLSLPPAILILFSLTGLFGGEAIAQLLTERLEEALPADASEIVEGFVDDVVREREPAILSLGVVILLWAASNVFMALSRSLEQAYDVPKEESRGWLKQRALTIGVFLLVAVFFIAGSSLLIGGPHIARALDLWGAAEVAWAVLQWPIAFFLIVAAFWYSYYILPAHDTRGEKLNLLVGAVFAATLWLVATSGFRFYIASFGNYADTYGFLGAIIVLQLWMWITAIVVLLGGELASELPRRSRGTPGAAIGGA